MALKNKSALMWILGLMVIFTAMVTFRIADIQVLNETIDPIASWVFVGGFVGIYLLSDREIGNLENYEGVSLLIPVIIAIGVQTIPQVSDFLAEYNPAMGIILTGVTLVAFYTLATNMDLSYVVIELILGVILALAASLQYGVLSIEVLNNTIGQISVWVFVFTLAGAYVVSERSLGTFTRMEGGAMTVGIGSYLAYAYVPEVTSIIQEHNPVSGVVLTLAICVSFYIIMNNGELR